MYKACKGIGHWAGDARYRLVGARAETCQPHSLQERGEMRRELLSRSLKKMWLGNLFDGRIPFLVKIIAEQALS